MQEFTVCLGTVGSGIFFSRDGGQRWLQSKMEVPFPPWSPWIQIRAIAASPHNPKHLLAGSDVGVHLSEDGGATWTFVHSAADKVQVWTTTWHPTDPNLIFVGCAPFSDDRGTIYRSKDRGQSWDQLSVPVQARSKHGATHVTSLIIDPRDEDTIWATVEIDGVFRSTNRGDTWTKLPPLGPLTTNSDIHNIRVNSDNGDIYITTPNGFWTSTDGAKTFSLHEFPEFPGNDEDWYVGANGKSEYTTYTRALALKANDSNTIFAGVGDHTPGKIGGIQWSRDGAKTWTPCAMNQTPNAAVYNFAVNPADPDTLMATTTNGFVYRTRNGGQNWEKLSREFGEVRALAWIPN
jgi:photosystem II stability/assembly factor-like uncharacterized protein